MSTTLAQVLDVGRDEILGVGRRGLQRRRVGRPAPRPRCPPRSSALARSWIHRVTSVSAGPPLGGLYLKPPSSGGLCDGVITMPSARCSRRPRLWTRIAREIDRRRREAVVALDPRLDAVGRQHLERRALRGAGQRVRVLAHEQRAVDALRAPVVADRLRDREDVRLGEGAGQRRAAVAAGAEGDPLRGIGEVGAAVVVRALERGEVDQQFTGCRLAGERGEGHGRCSRRDAGARRAPAKVLTIKVTTAVARVLAPPKCATLPRMGASRWA